MQPDVSITVCVGTNVTLLEQFTEVYQQIFRLFIFNIKTYVKMQIILYIFSLPLSLYIQLKLHMVSLHMHGLI